MYSAVHQWVWLPGHSMQLVLRWHHLGPSNICLKASRRISDVMRNTSQPFVRYADTRARWEKSALALREASCSGFLELS